MLKSKCKLLTSMCITMILSFIVSLPVYAGSAISCNCSYEFDKTTGHLFVGKEIEKKKIEDIVSIPKEEIRTVTIRDGVTSIGDSAFEGCKGLTSITIPDSVREISECAFYQCQSLTSVTIGNGVTEIGQAAFAMCPSLTSINVDKGNQHLKSIDGILFSKDETKLIKYPANKMATNYIIPDSVTSIGEYAFDSCQNLTSMTIPDTVAEINNGTFAKCTKLASINIPNTVASIGYRAFQGCESLTSITIPDSVTYIGELAFFFCTGLTSVDIPDSVTSIDKEAFGGCEKLEKVIIPKSTKIVTDGGIIKGFINTFDENTKVYRRQ